MDKAPASVFGEVDTRIEAHVRSGKAALDLNASIITDLERNGVKFDELYTIVGSKDEIARLVQSGTTLPHELAERVSRLAHIVSLAEKVFGQREKAFLWLRLPNQDLNETAPIDLVRTETGARIVEDTLLRIEYSVSA
jgi:putative toxin-antitoxin system antitoxin component (TIGR02293 family)